MSKRKMRVLFLDFTDFFGGGEQFLLNNFQYWNPSLDMFFFVSNQLLFDRLETKNKWLWPKVSYLGFYRFSHRINRFISEFAIDLVVFNGNKPMYFIPFVLGAKKVLLRHSCLRELPRILRWFIFCYTYFCLWLSDRIICVSNYSHREISAFPSKERVICNGVDSDYFRKARSDQREKINVLTIIRIEKEKGVFECLDALSEFSQEFPDFEYRIVGTGSELKRLQALAQNRKKFPFLEVRGFRSQIKEELEWGDIFISPSRSESFPISILEAMSMELPILAARMEGIPEVVKENTNGFLFEFFDKEEFKGKLKRLLLDAGLRKQFGDQSRLLIEREFRVAVTSRRFLEVFLEASQG